MTVDRQRALATLRDLIGRASVTGEEANAVAYLALFVALGGTSYAAVQLPKNSVGSAQIGDGSVSFGDLETAAQPDKDLDLLKSGPITVDDPVDGNTTTTAILSYGPFTIYGNCRDVTSTAQISYTMVSTEHGWVTASTSSPDDFNPGEVKAISGTLASGTDYTIAGGGYALTDSGRFLSFGVIGVNKTGGQTDCLYHASGWGG